MSYSHQEVAANAAKEIILGLIDNGRNFLLQKSGGGIASGVDLANHLGECYDALFKKIKSALQE